jgi:hypothetical protein
MPDEIQEHDEKHVNGVIDQLLKHFDTVQVFVTRQEPDGQTVAFSPGKGNWYARYGQITEWLENGGSMSKDGDDL